MPPPPTTLGKRKTLAERAGEPTARPGPVPPSTRPTSAAGGSSIANFSRQTSFSSLTSSMRPQSAASLRNASNSSFGNSYSSTHRAPSAQSYRSSSALGTSKMQRGGQNLPRPQNAMERKPTASGAGRVTEKPNGMPSFPFPHHDPWNMVRNGSDGAQYSRTRGWGDKPSALQAHRDVSISTAMNKLSLDEQAPQPASTADQNAPETPSQIPKLRLKPGAQIPFPSAELSSPCRSPKKTLKPLPLYLNKNSNTEIAWDTDSKIAEFETMFSRIQGQMNGISDECISTKELVAIYKAKSM